MLCAFILHDSCTVTLKVRLYIAELSKLLVKVLLINLGSILLPDIQDILKTHSEIAYEEMSAQTAASYIAALLPFIIL